MTPSSKRPSDRRVQKTEQLLHEALGALIHEKPYDDIAVKEILVRANVGRSTFYTHYRDKDALLVSGISEILRRGRSAKRPRSASNDDILWFSMPVFEHLEQHRRDSEGRMGIGGRAIVHGHLQQVVTALVADELKRDSGHGDSEHRIPPALIARHVAATFVLVLNWWVESRTN